MSCSPFDLRDYFLKELPDPERRQVEAHVKTCAGCREELQRLGVTEAALLSAPDEEIPQRIAFVSDKIFNPSRWQRLWGSAARLGFASAAMLSIAILVSALTHPAPKFADLSGIRQEMDQHIAKAVAESEARQTQKTVELVRTLEQRAEQEHKSAMVALNEADYYQRRVRALEMAASDYGPPRTDGDLR